IALNALADPNRIFAGQTLRIATDAPAPAVPAATAAAPPASATHVVQPGENLTWIARRYGVSVGAIAAANGIANASRIYAGQQIVIPGSAPAPAPAATPPPAPAAAAPAETTTVAAQVHVVQRGETLIGIARRSGVSVDAIVAANGIANASRIYAGQQLTIPAPGSGASPAAAALNLPTATQALMAERDAVRQIIVQEAASIGMPASFALAVAWQESGWQQSVVSHAGAVGIMQLMPATVAWVGESMLGVPVDMYDARQNVRAGVRLLAHYLGRYGGSHELALAAYYQGQRALDLHGIYPVSKPYIASVLALEAAFGG
ncbi:MAG TPA: LysM peptidoglycan-binding domain-containing protein, partial [Candidatus Limnocylindria bacterium]|nr:LysM peptidoglycan-binding domain-containing protein [Candidatus Limnocylindria bacterium]